MKPNLAIRMLMAMGLGNVFQRAPSFAPQPPESRSRFGRNVGIRAVRKEKFNNDVIDGRLFPWTHLKLQRKAALGEIGLTKPRGLQARANPNGSLRITR